MLRMGLDLGGTKIEGAVLDPKGDVLFRKRVATEQDEGYEKILDNLLSLYHEMCLAFEGKPHTLGIGTPGALSAHTGLMKNSNTLCLNGRLSFDELTRLFKRPLTIENDANCFALAEAVHGAGRGKGLVFGVIMGTGCGGGIIYDGQLVKGLQHIAGEWGHMSIDPEGPECYCGSRGCVETFISGGGLERLYASETGSLAEVKEIVEAYRKRGEQDQPFMERFFQRFGRSLANLINILDPDTVVLGGGLSNIDELYTEGIKAVRRQVFTDTMTTEIVKNELGDSAGVIGAALNGV